MLAILQPLAAILAALLQSKEVLQHHHQLSKPNQCLHLKQNQMLTHLSLQQMQICLTHLILVQAPWP